MAESKPTHNTKDLTECGICLCTIEEPKALPCLHTYCLKCLSKWAEGKTDTIRCPICTQDFDIPSGGIKAFRTNFFINTLKDRQATSNTLQSKDNSAPCVSCEVVGREPKGYCTSCNGFICEQCNANHVQMKALSNHMIFPCEDLKSGKVDLKNLSKKQNCKIHEGQVLWFFCETCETLICRDCTVLDHPPSKHSLVSLEAAVKEHKKEIESLIQCCEELQAKTENSLVDIDNVSDQLDKNVDIAEAGIVESYNEALKILKAQLDQRQNRLKGEVNKVRSAAKKRLDTQRDEIQTLQTRLLTALQMATEVTKTGSDYDLAVIYSSLKSNLTELKDSKLATVDRYAANISFKPAQIGQETEKVQKLGSVEVKKRKQEIGVWKLERQFGNNGAEKLQGGQCVAITPDECIAVADTTGRSIKVYDNIGMHKSTIKVPGKVYSVVASANGRFYVVCQTKEVYAYNGEGQPLFRFLSKSPGNKFDAQKASLFGLAIDNHESLLVGEDTQKFVSRHSLDGTHLASFKVTISPRKIAATPENNIIISEGDKENNSDFK